MNEETKRQRREAFDKELEKWLSEAEEVGFTREQAEFLFERFSRVTMNNQLDL